MQNATRVQTIRLTEPRIQAWAPLMRAYMREAYGVEWAGSEEAARAGALGQHCTVELALDAAGALLGFLAWYPSYDLHHCVAGVDVLDLYVLPSHRSRGIALTLACAVAASASVHGGSYMKGTAIGRGAGLRLYSRFGVCDPTGCIVGGRAFRRLVELAGRPARDIARSLPERSWNFEA